MQLWVDWLVKVCIFLSSSIWFCYFLVLFNHTMTTSQSNHFLQLYWIVGKSRKKSGTSIKIKLRDITEDYLYWKRKRLTRWLESILPQWIIDWTGKKIQSSKDWSAIPFPSFVVSNKNISFTHTLFEWKKKVTLRNGYFIEYHFVRHNVYVIYKLEPMCWDSQTTQLFSKCHTFFCASYYFFFWFMYQTGPVLLFTVHSISTFYRNHYMWTLINPLDF